MKKISVYTRDGYSGSSSYYRILQYTSKINLMDNYQVRNRIVIPVWLTKKFYLASDSIFDNLIKLLYYVIVFFRTQLFFISDIISKPDCIVILRAITPKVYFPPLSCLYKNLICHNSVIWDFDDNILESNEITLGEFDILSKYANFIIVTNLELQRLVNNNKNNIILIPTTDGDFSSYSFEHSSYNRINTYKNIIYIVWVASSTNLIYLQEIMPALDSAAQKLLKNYKKKLILKCVCNKPIEYQCHSLIIENIKWTRHQAIDAIKQSHIGIMPLDDTKFTRGKGGFKIIQYMACGIPAIASGVGYNNEIIENEKSGILVNGTNIDSWYCAIIKLATNIELWKRMCYCSYSRWKTNFNYEDTLKKWLNIICKAMEEK